MKSLKALVLGASVAAGVGAVGLFGTDASANEANSYKVQPGDTLAKISQKFAGDLSLVQSIASTNGIANPDVIYAGATLTIPSQAAQVQPVQQAQQVQQPAQKEVYQSPKKTTVTTQVAQQKVAPKTTTQVTSYKSATTSSAKEWIANKESGGSYEARSATGKYIGRYQLDGSYLNGDYSAANQERVANRYVTERYGSWDKAKQFWLANGWY